MPNAFFKCPTPHNEPVLDYAPGSPERQLLEAELVRARAEEKDIPMFIGGQDVTGVQTVAIRPPHDLAHCLGHYHKGDQRQVKQAIDAALKAKPTWENMDWQDRAAIFLKAADLISGPYRAKINAATMLGQSKNVNQAEIDAVAELCDFLRFNVAYMNQIYAEQPANSKNIWNRLEYRPLEGFVFALTPFNFTAIAGNLPSSAALMGNTVVWKPAEAQIYAARLTMDIFREAGLPDGVINLVFVDGPQVGEVVFQHPDFAGLHFTGSTTVFQQLWKTIGENIATYRSYPRIVGETGGKDFVVAHPSADTRAVATALSRGAFEFQGQKCSAASRAYLPQSQWLEIQKYLLEDLASFKMGPTEDFKCFINAVIDEKAFDKIASYIDFAKAASNAKIIAGGEYDKRKGYFIAPTVIVTEDPHFKTMEEEIFGPVLTIYVYDDKKFEDTLALVNTTSPYALTGSIFARDRQAIALASQKLKHAAGNFYINDKPTGAVVGQQPFGGARGSGTNDKAGSVFNLLRWVSPRLIKENFVPPHDYRYPFLD